MIAIYGEYFPPAKPKELLREEKEWLTDIGRNSWLWMKCAPNVKIWDLWPPGGGHNK